MTRPEHSAILRFAVGGPDHRGRTRQDILARDDRWLEDTHDYIQWLFPLPEPSPYNPEAPVLGRDDIAAFRADASLREGLLDGFDRMLAFYGFESLARLEPPRPDAAWISPRNHNLLRISRILRSLALLGCEQQAGLFHQALERLAEGGAGPVFGAVTLAHWRAAARGALPGARLA